MKQSIQTFKTLLGLNKQYERYIKKGYIVKDIHLSQCIIDQPHVILYDKITDTEVVMMVGEPLQLYPEKKISRYNKKLDKKKRHKRKHKYKH